MAWPPERPPKESLPYLPSPTHEDSSRVERWVNPQQFKTMIGLHYKRVTHDPYKRESN